LIDDVPRGDDVSRGDDDVPRGDDDVPRGDDDVSEFILIIVSDPVGEDTGLKAIPLPVIPGRGVEAGRGADVGETIGCLEGVTGNGRMIPGVGFFELVLCDCGKASVESAVAALTAAAAIAVLIAKDFAASTRLEETFKLLPDMADEEEGGIVAGVCNAFFDRDA
jgi:hypothetical protein